MAARLSPERWQVLAPYLDRAFDLDEPARAAWLAALHDDEPAIAAELAALLAQHRALDAEGFLAGAPVLRPTPSSFAGQVLGAYTLRSPLGQGGMGTVWLAERTDGRFEGRVAVKLLNASLTGPDGAARFKREGSILARLRHPHIAHLIDAGVSPAGQPYLVLEHVDGQRIDRHCDARALDVAARVRLFLDVLDALAHAHANLVVHRDLKPSNVMVDASGRVKLLDFGIAKLLAVEPGDADAVTREGYQALTPLYAAPEQLRGGDITTATDVYALGVLLYLILTGRHPAGPDTSSPAELVRAIVETEPARLSDAFALAPTVEASADEVAARRATTPRKLRTALRGDLDNIVAKALKKAAAERYPSAAAMADDLRRYLEHRPVSARADSWRYRSWKLVVRHRVALGAAVLVVAALVTGTGLAVWQARTAARQRDRALVQLSRAEATNDLASFLLSEATPSAGRPVSNAELLARGEALVEHRFADEPALQAHMLLMLSERYHENDQFDRWQATVDRAFVLTRSSSDVGLRARAACVKAAAMDDQGQAAAGDVLLGVALRDLATLPDAATDEIYCRVCEANMANGRGDSVRAIAAAQRAVTLEEARSGPAGRGYEALFLLANAYLVGNHAVAADGVFARLIAMLERQGLGDTRDAALVLSNWSTMLQNAGQPLRAVALSERAVRIARARDSEHGASLAMLRSYGSALCAVGRCAAALPVRRRGRGQGGDRELAAPALPRGDHGGDDPRRGRRARARRRAAARGRRAARDLSYRVSRAASRARAPARPPGAAAGRHARGPRPRGAGGDPPGRSARGQQGRAGGRAGAGRGAERHGRVRRGPGDRRAGADPARRVAGDAAFVVGRPDPPRARRGAGRAGRSRGRTRRAPAGPRAPAGHRRG
ncbi:MAG: serine/threonine-protein kinase [Kofleriaceae bacterium]